LGELVDKLNGAGAIAVALFIVAMHYMERLLSTRNGRSTKIPVDCPLKGVVEGSLREEIRKALREREFSEKQSDVERRIAALERQQRNGG
jgi:hypothetical protein